ncbi:hypothetical protein CAMGR0001_0804 [Campylobacter gracilis RM3268]|uniref:Uncharacterized protein n=1 Tax=Campylobacter gracilis RM3268 TaxID=553220 RepID=C8PG11_9BACT|nr:hypothetical protein CAMGR0001_0804 [Campylobacter gracilis RM3268]
MGFYLIRGGLNLAGSNLSRLIRRVKFYPFSSLFRFLDSFKIYPNLKFYQKAAVQKSSLFLISQRRAMAQSMPVRA